MFDCSRTLGDAVKQAREKLGMTQSQLATYLDVDPRTILNIENYKGNPKLSLLFSLLRVLKIDARIVFNPEMKPSSPALIDLHYLIDSCDEAEASAILPIVRDALDLARNKSTTSIG